MKQLPKLLSLQIILIILSISIHWNSSSAICSKAFGITEDMVLDLGLKAEELVKNYKLYEHNEVIHLSNTIWNMIRRWESKSIPFVYEDFITLKNSVEQLEALSKNLAENKRAEHSNNSTVSQEPVYLLNSIINSKTPIEINANTTYTVEPPNTYPFRVIFLPEIVEKVNQDRNSREIKRSMRALLLGPVKRAKSQTGIKKIASDYYEDLFEIKIMGNHGVGNFRIGMFLYKGVYYVTKYTKHHIENQKAFIESLHRARLQTIASLAQAH